MDFIDHDVALGSILDAELVNELKEAGIEFIVDARVLFDRTGPLLNDLKPRVEDLLHIAGIIARDAAEDRVKILIHCTFGKDRTPLVGAAYYAKRYGVSYKEAYEQVKLLHPETVYHWDWLEMLENEPGGRV